MFTAGTTYVTILGVQLFHGEQVVADGDFEVIYSRRCAGPRMDFSYGIVLDILADASTIIRIMENGQEVRQYNENQD